MRTHWIYGDSVALRFAAGRSTIEAKTAGALNRPWIRTAAKRSGIEEVRPAAHNRDAEVIPDAIACVRALS